MGSPGVGVFLSALSSPRGAGARTAGLGGGAALEWDEPGPTSELGRHAQGSEPRSLGFLICETRRRLTASLTGVGTLQPDNVRMVSAKGQRRVTAKSHDCDLDREQQRVATRHSPAPGPWCQPAHPRGHPGYLASLPSRPLGKPCFAGSHFHGNQGTRGQHCGCESH